ncbi:MAG: hypothetical protein ABI893_12075, partial [Polaromonas sp.]
GHDEPGLLAFNGGRFGDLAKNRRSAGRARSGDEADGCEVLKHGVDCSQAGVCTGQKRPQTCLKRLFSGRFAAKKHQQRG